jgi:hypothetical protein
MLTKEQIIKEHYQEVGRKGGQSTSKAKKEAALANLEKALQKRWKKKIRLRKIKPE